MYARLITATVAPSKLDEFVTKFSEVLLPLVSRERGYKSTYVMKDAAQNRFTILILWETESDAAGMDGNLSKRLPAMEGFLTDQPGSETLEVLLRA